MKKKLLILLAILIGLALVGFIILKIMTANAERHVASEKAIDVSVDQLVDAYTVSADSANKKYLDKTLALGAAVFSVDSNESHQSVILLKTDPAKPGVLCTFDKKVDGVWPGDTLFCKGICTGFLSNVTLKDCIVIKIVKNNAPDTPKLVKPGDTLKAVKPNIDSPATKKTVVFSSSKAQITFDAGGSVEDIKATNNQAEASIGADGVIKFKVPVLGFKFPDALMQQHFNEEYMESTKFPVASFTGNITNIGAVDLNKDGSYTAQVSGDLVMHGVSKKINTTAAINIHGGKLTAQSSIEVKLADYKINTDAASKAVISIRF